MDLSKIKNRSQMGKFLNENGLTGIGVEVGSKNCVFASEIIADWNGQKMFLIDPWQAQDPSIYKERQDWTNFADCEKECIQLHDKYPTRIVLLKGLSKEMAPRFKTHELDWVYIDANHCYEAVMEDLDLWWHKVKPGGLFCGHDCYDQVAWPAHCEVQKALNEWVTAAGLSYHRTDCTSWWIEKV